ncbi:MAG: DUF1223 domain-containing protein [Xanthobacteraceae bacterium]
MGSCRVALLLCAVVASTAPTYAGETRAVIELFTSQGCSSCPPADELLGKLAADPSLVAMSLPIDYWDYLGWKDTLAKPGHTARQRAYASARGDRAVYTPQAVVNGAVHVQGSDKAAIERAIGQTRHQAGTLSLPVAVSVEGGRIDVKVPASADVRGKGDIWLCALTAAVPIAIGRGENRGRTITYHNVVRRWMKLGQWNGVARSVSVPVSDLEPENASSVAVLVQAGEDGGTPGRILGAATATLR